MINTSEIILLFDEEGMSVHKCKKSVLKEKLLFSSLNDLDLEGQQSNFRVTNVLLLNARSTLKFLLRFWLFYQDFFRFCLASCEFHDVFGIT